MQNYADMNENVFPERHWTTPLMRYKNLSDDIWTDMSSEVTYTSENDSEISEVQYNSLCHWRISMT